MNGKSSISNPKGKFLNHLKFLLLSALFSLFKWKKNCFRLTDLIGKRFNSYFEVENQELIPLQVKQLHEEIVSNSSSEDEPEPENPIKEKINPIAEKTLENFEKDNRDLYDKNNAQKIKAEDIQRFKAEGGKAINLVTKLKENSETFQKKTQFSQEKYIKKKKSK